MVQLSHPYMTTGKTIALTNQTFVSKVTSLLFNILSRVAIAFLPRSKHLWILWLQVLSTVILEPKKINSVTFFPSVCMKWWDQMPWSSFFECWVLSQLFCSLLSPSTRGSLVLCFLPLECLSEGSSQDHHPNQLFASWSSPWGLLWGKRNSGFDANSPYILWSIAFIYLENE